MSDVDWTPFVFRTVGYEVADRGNRIEVRCGEDHDVCATLGEGGWTRVDALLQPAWENALPGDNPRAFYKAFEAVLLENFRRLEGPLF